MTENHACSVDNEMRFSSIFKSLDAVKKCLHSEKYCNLPEVKDLLRIFNEKYSACDEVVDRTQRQVFIVLEGIDAAGKTTLGKKLSKLLKGKVLSTPPEDLLWLRSKFDNHNNELRRAYYALGNYLAASQVRQTYRTKAVVMDRFWHSTAAYAIALDSSRHRGGEVPPRGDDVYQWPADLLKPDIVFFLSVSEEKRLERLLNRTSKPITAEEDKMKDDKLLREAILECFLRISNPELRMMNANYFNKGFVKSFTDTLTAEGLIQPLD